jgi:hypothetical protein
MVRAKSKVLILLAGIPPLFAVNDGGFDQSLLCHFVEDCFELTPARPRGGGIFCCFDRGERTVDLRYFFHAWCELVSCLLIDHDLPRHTSLHLLLDACSDAFQNGEVLREILGGAVTICWLLRQPPQNGHDGGVDVGNAIVVERGLSEVRQLADVALGDRASDGVDGFERRGVLIIRPLPA